MRVCSFDGYQLRCEANVKYIVHLDAVNQEDREEKQRKRLDTQAQGWQAVYAAQPLPRAHSTDLVRLNDGHPSVS